MARELRRRCSLAHAHPAHTPSLVQVTAVNDADEWAALGTQQSSLVCFFWADFHEPSKTGGQMDTVFTQLANMHPDVGFAKVPP